MACFYCQTCDRLIDLDYDVDHEQECAIEHGLIPDPLDAEPEEATPPRRINTCANREGGCKKWCPPGEFYCSGHCRAACDERDAQKHIGGSLERHESRNPCDPDDHPTVTQRNWRGGFRA